MNSPRVLLVHRSYRTKGGEDYFLEGVISPALRDMGVVFDSLVFPPLKISSWRGVLEFVGMALGWERLRPSYREIGRRVREFRPTHVIFNNMIPTLSLAAPYATRKSGAKTYLWAHNARLYCANGLTFNGQEECRRCVTRGSHWAFLQKCHTSRLQSLVYAWIYRRQRVAHVLRGGLDQIVAVSDYTARGIRQALETVDVITVRNPSPTSKSADASEAPLPEYVNDLVHRIEKLPQPVYAFVGRISEEKGADQFVDLARRFPEAGFVLCGEGPLLSFLKPRFPTNLVYAGVVGEPAKAWIYQHAAALIICSRVPENAPLVISESQPYATPIVYPSGGGAEESVAFFGRSGCLIGDFRAQTFERKARKISDGEFERNLEALFKACLR